MSIFNSDGKLDTRPLAVVVNGIHCRSFVHHGDGWLRVRLDTRDALKVAAVAGGTVTVGEGEREVAWRVQRIVPTQGGVWLWLVK